MPWRQEHRFACLWMTAGDHNIVGPPLFWRRVAVTPAQFRDIGHRRMKEATAAARVLGLSPDDLVFLGYPDSGLSDIFMNIWTSKPYRSGLTNVTSVPYTESMVFGQPQTAINLLTDLEQVMTSFQPTIIAYPNLIDDHPDHQATELFVTAALADLQLSPHRLEYVVHVKGWPRPLRYAPFVDAYAPPATTDPGSASGGHPSHSRRRSASRRERSKPTLRNFCRSRRWSRLHDGPRCFLPRLT